MKRLLLLIVLSVISITLAGCGPGGKYSPGENVINKVTKQEGLVLFITRTQQNPSSVFYTVRLKDGTSVQWYEAEVVVLLQAEKEIERGTIKTNE